MNQSERIAERHLRSRGYVDIVYEPDGNVPPDFLLNGSIAVEVRRLNEHDFTSSPPEGLETAEVSLIRRLARLLTSYGTSQEMRFIHADFGRPLPSWKAASKAIRAFLDDMLAGNLPRGSRRAVTSNLVLEYSDVLGEPGDTFELSGPDDLDSGGFVLPLLEENLNFCITEKAGKIAPYRSRYPQWWLVLIDHLTYESPSRARSSFRRVRVARHGWDKIAVVRLTNHTDYLDL